MRGLPSAALAALALVAGCAGGSAPAPIAFGEAACDHCHMTIVDQRFAAELVTRTGKVYAFDDAGCLAAFATGGLVEPADIRSMWVTDFRAPGTLIPAGEATFLHTDSVRTPMASNLLAVPASAGDSLRALLGGTLLDWAQVLTAARAPA